MTAIAQPAPGSDWTAAALRMSAIALVGVVWISSAIFGLYILAWYVGAIPANTLEDWNHTLPRLYEAATPAASAGIGLHFLAGAVLLLLGPIQLIGEVRRRAPTLHRWIGRIYAGSALLAGVGGLAFIAIKGTVGGWVMSVAFASYGALMVLAAAQTVRHAIARRIEVHRAWAIRLFALAIGSWLYRMGYGFWFLFAGETGHTDDFRGWFDYVMNFAFFVPPLIVAELVVRARREETTRAGRALALTGVSAGAAFIALATFFFTLYGWGPAIAVRFGAA
ncbi:DUF2306 domain-containing protein [bacterium]|nr:DUF2306 domain-containing protein [bacterium]